MSAENGPGLPSYFFREQADLIDRRPRVVQKQTADLLDLYFGASLINYNPLRNYLSEYTVPLIKDIKAGLEYRKEKAHLRQNDSLSNKYRQLHVDEDVKAQEQVEAFDLALTTFAYLPDHHQTSTNKFGFSRRATLKPPTTPKEFLWRTTELYMFINGIIEGFVPQNASLSLQTDTMRAYAFFKRGSEMPMRLQQQIRETFRGKPLRINPHEKYRKEALGIKNSPEE